MFRTFEPRPPAFAALVTTGELSPPLRHDIGQALGRLGYATQTVPGAAHFIAVDSPDAVALLIRGALADAQ
jgi:pimeloyl-ACP methyl ester carboxylesterase